MTPDRTLGADPAPSCGDVLDAERGLPRVLSTKCATCIYRPGNRMHLPPGYRDQLAHDALAHDSWIVCHATLPATGNPIGTQAICRGFWDVHAADSAGCRLATALGGPVNVPPPNQTRRPSASPTADNRSGSHEQTRTP
ncbi:hypothetical protein [Amycolatopsis taiwanensis]|uniref:Uncharacterized protein n=1 Tax=Amycolatopsis taiwanensis TaxID=342230 RepID=A0A9W6R3S7_9PSEU|nr:hypothetical protein [Amycolatopsis taiwanensis]GLY68733.1 hypothetical protein Atai01_53520 [Amycolatopsis taiwanensis]